MENFHFVDCEAVHLLAQVVEVGNSKADETEVASADHPCHFGRKGENVVENQVAFGEEEKALADQT